VDLKEPATEGTTVTGTGGCGGHRVTVHLLLHLSLQLVALPLAGHVTACGNTMGESGASRCTVVGVERVRGDTVGR
jgi:hypothetical protein